MEINFGLIMGRCCFDKKYQVIAPIILGLYWKENLVPIGGLYWTLMVQSKASMRTKIKTKIRAIKRTKLIYFIPENQHYLNQTN